MRNNDNTAAHEPPLVSICMLTYNLESFVGRAIEGVLMQEFDGTYRIMIGDDCSMDGTLKICQDFQNLHPEKIKILVHDKNMGISENFRRTLNACEGKYVAICEGDDYWTDPNKLARQIEFLESNPEYSMCFQNFVYEYNDDTPNQVASDVQTRDYSFEDFLERRVGVATQTMVFRRDTVPQFSEEQIVFDWPILLLTSHAGKVRYFSDAMSVYRKHSTNWTNNYSSQKAEFMLKLTEQCRELFSPNYSASFDRWLAHCHADVCFASFQEGDRAKFDASWPACIRYWAQITPNKRRALLLRHKMIGVPVLANIFRLLRSMTRRR